MLGILREAGEPIGTGAMIDAVIAAGQYGDAARRAIHGVCA
jgi:hypothetical protein